MNSAQLKTIQSNFLHELQDASSGKKTSLPFIIHQVPSSPYVKILVPEHDVTFVEIKESGILGAAKLVS